MRFIEELMGQSTSKYAEAVIQAIEKDVVAQHYSRCVELLSTCSLNILPDLFNTVSEIQKCVESGEEKILDNKLTFGKRTEDITLIANLFQHLHQMTDSSQVNYMFQLTGLNPEDNVHSVRLILQVASQLSARRVCEMLSDRLAPYYYISYDNLVDLVEETCKQVDSGEKIC